MMNAEQLSRVGEKLVKRCGSRDPFEIARQLGINVMLCENFGSLKGMYRVIKRNRFIFLNNSLDENMLRIVCAHELGHDQLHRNMAKTTPIHEFMLYDMKSKPEYEANIVAAEILMDSDEVLRYIYEYGYTDGGAQFGVMWEEVGIDPGLPFEEKVNLYHMQMLG